MKWHIVLGTLALVLTMAVLAFLALNEPARMDTFIQGYEARRIEQGASLFQSNCSSCHGVQGKGIEGVAPALNAADLFNGQRLERVGWTGTLEDYLEGVIAAGRPVPSAGTTYPQRMPTWGQEFGGPLRPDQIDALVAFIMNWEERALAEAEAPPLEAPSAEMVGTDITIALPEGDPERGKALSEGALGCSGCHVLATVGPPWSASGDLPSLEERAAQRIAAQDYSGEAADAQQYLIESILKPDAYVVAGYPPGVMPKTYGERMTAQDLADVLAYMLSFR